MDQDRRHLRPLAAGEGLSLRPGASGESILSAFSYAFAWWLEGRPELDAPRLERDLARYFAGLCGAVGEGKFTFAPGQALPLTFAIQASPSNDDSIT